MNNEKNVLIRFYEKIGLTDRIIQQGIIMFWLISASLTIKFLVGLFIN